MFQGPLNPNVFDETSDREFKNIPDEVIKQGKVLQNEIIQLLTQVRLFVYQSSTLFYGGIFTRNFQNRLKLAS